jgi:RNA polymerase primary sigma factor
MSPSEPIKRGGDRPSAGGRDVMTDFLNRIGRVDLLTPEEERELGTTVQAGIAARAELEAAAAAETADAADGANAAEALDPVARQSLLRTVARGERARREFVEANLRLVVSIARTYRTSGVDLADLVQEGNVGLLRAVERFDPSFGVRFSTYATYWIRQAVRHGMSKMGHAIALPDDKRASLLELRRAEEDLTQVLGRTPTETEIAGELGLSVEALYQLRRTELRVVSANVHIGEDGETELLEMLDGESEQGDDAVDRSDLSEALDKVLANLGERDREILRLRFGFATGRVETLETVAKNYGITRERVRQLELQAVSRLRRNKTATAILDTVRDA